MAPNLTSGAFNILSLIDGNPAVGINLILPGLQFVYLNAPVTAWNVQQEGKNYRFSIGSYGYTGVIDRRVVVSIHPRQNTEWIATYREAHDAYTISPINDNVRGWTVADVDDTNAQIALRHIRSTKSLPPRFSASQLFRFEEIDE